MLAMSAILLMMGCSVTKKSTESTAQKETRTNTTATVDTSVTRQNEGKTAMNITQSEGLAIYSVQAEEIAGASASMEIPIESIGKLPDGSGYTSREGRAAISVTKNGNAITVTGQCDSINRLLRFYREMSFEQCRQLDSLQWENSQLIEANTRQASELESVLIEKTDKRDKPPETRHWWALAGFTAGLMLYNPLDKLKTKITTIIKDKILWHT